MPRGICLLEEVEFHPMNSRRPLEYLEWLTAYKREDEALERGRHMLTQGHSIRSREIDLVGAFYAVGRASHRRVSARSCTECACLVEDVRADEDVHHRDDPLAPAFDEAGDTAMG